MSYESGADVKAMDALSYAEAAADFARLTEQFSTDLAALMVDIAGIRADDLVLDLGAGTGLVAITAAERVRGAKVVGIDHSERMLSQAEAKAAAHGLADRITFEPMDAEDLKFPDRHFHQILSLFVLRHLPNAERAVREMYRVLQPGGRVVISVGARPQLMSGAGVKAALRRLVDQALVATGRRAVAPSALRDLLDRNHVVQPGHQAAHGPEADVPKLLRRAGFFGVCRSWWRGEHHLTPEQFWDVQAIFDSECRSRLMGLEPGEVARLKSRFLDESQKLTNRGGALVYRTGAYVYSAERPS